MKTILVLLLLIPFIYAQVNCPDFGNCTSCAAQKDCGWCSTTQQCLQGTGDGPGTGKCLGPAWHFGQYACPTCNQLRDCRQCNLHPSDCGWCNYNGIQGCYDLSWFSATPSLGRCKAVTACPCENYYSCDTCIDGSNCHWCDATSTCQSETKVCSSGTSYDIETGCPCKYNTDCTSCREAYNCQWCNNLGACQERNSTGGSPCLVSVGSCNSYCSSNGNTSCNACNNLNGCAWCSNSKQCVDERFGGCSPLAHTCEPLCSNHKYCDPCFDAGCTWCESTGTCKQKSAVDSTCMAALSCPDMCARFSGCSACNNARGCGWCTTANGGEGGCLDVDKSVCSGMFAHSCQSAPVIPPKTGGFDGGSFVGGMFLVIGIIVICGAGYLFYRWKTGRKILYTELR